MTELHRVTRHTVECITRISASPIRGPSEYRLVGGTCGNVVRLLAVSRLVSGYVKIKKIE